MKVEIPSQPRGIALIIVMLVIVVFGILAGGFAYSMKVETKLARNSTMDVELEWLGRSGVERAKWILAQKCEPFDALNQIWAGGGGSLCESNGPLAGLAVDNYELGRGSFSLKIVDLDRKCNINTISVQVGNTELLDQALTMPMGMDAAEAKRIKSAILDWTDPDDNTQMGSSDTESAYYLSLDPPYRAKNGPIDDITELLLIHGVTPAMFYGSGTGAQVSHRSIQRSGLGHSELEEPVYPVGLSDLFTTLSAGRININTASAEVLECIPMVGEFEAQAIIAARAGPNDPPEGVENRMPFRSVQEVRRVPELQRIPMIFMQLERYGAVQSSTFEVNVEAQIDNYKRHFVSILRRDGNTMRELFFYWK